MVLEGLAADSQSGVMQPGSAVAQGAEPGRQVSRVPLQEFGNASDTAAPAITRGFAQRGILLNRGKDIS
ncbi:hypothetical protein [Methyloceanibacter sp.]|uniref:hypothetical protein n=1 Tax=Methyloceanibacter sp. TaxID=1965321 RepID=UPI003D6C82B2